MSSRIHRVTMFKLPSPPDQMKLLEAYKVLEREHKKEDGKPYILSMKTGVTISDPRSRGWTVVNKAEFASLEDMQYYDKECKAHAALKEKVKTLGIQGGVLYGVMVVYFEADPFTL
ncbi:stress responsive A/B barrel domain-containing protein [Xylaria cubensis]|nr:stress responsive A/B barrel domain-containing protein [Xylaria cubensis]